MRSSDEILIWDYLVEFEEKLSDLIRTINSGYVEVQLPGVIKTQLKYPQEYKDKFINEAIELANYIIRGRIALIRIKHCN